MEEVDKKTLEEKLSREELEKMRDEKDKKEGRKPGKVEEDLSIDDQMRISKEYNRKSPEEKRH